MNSRLTIGRYVFLSGLLLVVPPLPLCADSPAEVAESSIETLAKTAQDLRMLAETAAPGGDLTQATESLDFDADTIISYVRDNVRFEPYSGALKGAAGSLSARAGNALDQSLLLATLLKNAGFDTRIARGELDATNRLALAGAALTDVPEAAMVSDQATFDRALEELRVPLGARTLPKAVPPDQAGVPTDQVRAVAERLATIAPIEPDAEELDRALGEYFWVQWREAAQGGWKDAHPAFGSASAPAELEAKEYFADSIPDTYQHRLRFEVGIERFENGRLVREPLMPAWERPAANFFGTSVSLGIVPMQEAGDTKPASFFIPLLNGRAASGAKAFTLSGQLVDMDVASNSAAGVFKQVSKGFLSAAEQLSGGPSDQPLMSLSGQFIRVSWIRPDGRTRTEERWPLDRIANRGAEGTPRVDTSIDDTQVARKLEYLRTFLVQPAGEHAASSLRRSSAASASRLDWSKSLLSMVDWTKTEVAADAEQAPSLDNDHPLLLTLSTLTHHPMRAEDGHFTWRDGPFVASVHEVLNPHAENTAWLDVFFNPWSGARLGADAVEPWGQGAILRGVLDTAWEVAVGNPSEDYLAGRVVDIVAIGELQNAAQARDRAEGFILANVPGSKAETPRWWRIHPETGEVLGMSALGGAVTLEYVVGVIAVGVGAFLIGRSVGTCDSIEDSWQKGCCFLVAAGFGISGAAGIAAGVAAAPIGMTVGAALFAGTMTIKSMLVLDYTQSLATDAACN